MIELPRAFHLLMDAAEPLPAETVAAAEAAGRVAATPVAAPGAVPGFPRVMMDGYACRAGEIATANPDAPVALRVSGCLTAGQPATGGPGPGEAWEVATGAVLPAGADVVVPRERARREGERVLIGQSLPPGRHVAAPDEDIHPGEVLVEAGEVIGPAIVGAMVAAGIATVRVVRRPRVLLLSTGDELIPPAAAHPHGEMSGSGPAPAAPVPRVYNSNAAALAADLRAMGIETVSGGIVPDDPACLRAAFAEALRSDVDVILTTGGVSVGSRDRVPRTWLELGARRLLGRLDLKPGGPFFAARGGGKWIVCLSGSPASCLATFQVLVRPFLLRLAGRRQTVRPVVDVCLAEPFPKPADRPRLLWARLEGGAPPYRARLLTGTGGVGRLTGIARSNGLVWIPAGTPPLPAGACLRALRLDWPEDRAGLDDLCRGGVQLGAPAPRAGGAGREAGTAQNWPPVVAVVGVSGSGKTRVVAGLVRRLRGRGLQVVAIKHAAHGFTLDRPGTDSHRLAAAGAAAVWLVGPAEVAARFPAVGGGAGWQRWVEVAVRSWLRAAGRAPDLVLVEGFTSSDLPKIVVGRAKEEPVPGEVIARLPEDWDEEALDRLAAVLPGALAGRWRNLSC